MFLTLVKVNVNSNLIIHHSLKRKPASFQLQKSKGIPSPRDRRGKKNGRSIDMTCDEKRKKK